MVIIGVDPHKRMHVASVVVPATNRQVSALEVEASLAGYRRLLRWADKFGERSWAVENTRGLGRHRVQWLLARGEVVADVPLKRPASNSPVTSSQRFATQTIG